MVGIEGGAHSKLFVPGLDVHLVDNLAVTYVERHRSEYAGAVRIFARFVERYAILADDLIFDVVGHCPTADTFEVLGNLLLAM